MSVSSDRDDETSPLITEERRRLVRDSSERLQNISPIIHETDDQITVRRPVQYYSAHPQNRGGDHGERTRATINRYKYYSKLAPHRESTLLMPNHIVPAEYFRVFPVRSESGPGTQSSLVTIFSIWNTMMGTSLLSIPWAIEKAGFATGLTVLIIMAGITLYTAYRVMNSVKGLESQGVLEFCDVVQFYLGKWGYYISVVFSLLALLGAAIVYWVLMSNFLYHTGQFIFEKVNREFNTTASITIDNVTYADAFCPHPPSDPLGPSDVTPNVSLSVTIVEMLTDLVVTSDDSINTQPAVHTKDEVFHKYWSQTNTVPFFLILVLFPLVNFKSPTFFTKFNALGTVSVVYIVTFVAIKASQWGFHMDFNITHINLYIPEFQWTFPALTGMLSLAYFIHNCVVSVVRNQKYPENNGRDLTIAYVCVALTYLIIGTLFYTSFPLSKGCIEDNFLNNFRSSDILAFTARVFLFFQMMTVFPLITYILRSQFMHTVFGNIYPSIRHVILLNLFIVGLCLVFAVFMPQIGVIIRFSGAMCGLVWIFALPCLVYMLTLRERGHLTVPIVAVHVLIIVLGSLNFISQFLILGKA